MSRGGGHSVARPELFQLNRDIWLISLASEMTKDRQHDLDMRVLSTQYKESLSPEDRWSLQGERHGADTGSGGWGKNGRGVSNEYL